MQNLVGFFFAHPQTSGWIATIAAALFITVSAGLAGPASARSILQRLVSYPMLIASGLQTALNVEQRILLRLLRRGIGQLCLLTHNAPHTGQSGVVVRRLILHDHAYRRMRAGGPIVGGTIVVVVALVGSRRGRRRTAKDCRGIRSGILH